ncbi:hypothetical protein TSOC_012642, partial [Tetrabaena socialis]
VSDRHLSDRNIYSAAAKKLGTNLRNHLVVNLRRVVNKALADVPNDAERVLMLYTLYGWKGGPRKKIKPPKKAKTSSSVAPTAEIAPEPPPLLSAPQLDFIRECRRILGFTDDTEELTERWMDKPANLPRILAFFVHVNRLLDHRGELEDDPLNRGPTCFALLPICKIKRHFVTLDTHSIHGVARDAEIVGPECSSKAFLEHGEAHWASMVNHSKHLPQGGRFTGTIETDGVSVCIHYMRPKRKEAEEEADDGENEEAPKAKAKRAPPRPTPEQLSGSRVVVIDPGRTNIVYAVEVLPEAPPKIYRLTRSQYYQESGVVRGGQQAARWLRGVKEELAQLSAASPKGASLPLFQAFIATYLETCEVRWTEALKTRWAQQSLRLYGGKKRVVAKFFSEIACGDLTRPVVIGYGAAKFAPGGKGELSVPTSGVFKACRERFPTYLVDEFRTTKIHHADDSLLQGLDFIRECRRILGFTDDTDELTERWMDKPANLPRILAFFVHVNRLLEHRGELEDDPLNRSPCFALLPICKIKRHFVTLDTHSIHGVARDAEIVGPQCSSKAFLEHGEAHWASMVKHAKHLPKGGRFTGTIETDGVAVCIHYVRPKVSSEGGVAGEKGAIETEESRAAKKPKSTAAQGEEAEEKVAKKPNSSPPRPTAEQLARCRIVVIDPGRTNIIYAVEVTSSGVKVYRLTRAQYYQESGVARGKQQATSWLRGVKDELAQLSTVSPKGADLPAFLLFVATHLATSEARWEEAMKPRWAQMRLRLYGGKKRVLSRFFNEIARGQGGADSRPVVIAYGAAKFAPGGKGELSVPTSGVFKACQERFPTYLVDEFRTTKIHHVDDSLLQGVGERRWKGDNVKTVRGLLWCGSTNEKKSKFINRDFNGAMNIRRCFVSAERPAILDRSKCQGRLQFVRTGRVIRMK